MSERKFNPEKEHQGYVNISEALEILGQSQYVARPLTNAFPDDYPNLGEGIRYEGTYDNYHSIRIHPDDVLLYAERYIDYKNKTSFTTDKEATLRKIEENLKSIRE